MTISAILPVFNEEKRISDALKSIMWCDEIIVIDKFSTDLTVTLANRFGSKVKIYQINNIKGDFTSEVELFLKLASCEWILLFTASDVMHPMLAKKIRIFIENKNCIYDIIHIPYRRYVLGIHSERSPWYSETHPSIVKRKSIYIDKNEVHGAIKFRGLEYKFENSDLHCLYHLTHENADLMMNRHIRYWQGEALSETIGLRKSFMGVIFALGRVFFLRKTWLMGKDGMMLIFSYVSYFMMSYVYKWENMHGSASETYNKIKSNINDEWENTFNK